MQKIASVSGILIVLFVTIRNLRDKSVRKIKFHYIFIGENYVA